MADTLRAKLARLATWLRVAETRFGGLPDGVSVREAWLAMDEAAAELASLTAQLARCREEAVEAAASCADQWSNTGDLLLRCGEMTAQELRTAKAVADGIARAIRALAPTTGDG